MLQSEEDQLESRSSSLEPAPKFWLFWCALLICRAMFIICLFMELQSFFTSSPGISKILSFYVFLSIGLSLFIWRGGFSFYFCNWSCMSMVSGASFSFSSYISLIDLPSPIYFMLNIFWNLLLILFLSANISFFSFFGTSLSAIIFSLTISRFFSLLPLLDLFPSLFKYLLGSTKSIAFLILCSYYSSYLAKSIPRMINIFVISYYR